MPEFGARVGEVGSEVRVPQPGRFSLPVLLGAFGTFGLFSGTFVVLLADLSRALDLSPGPLGFALFVGAATSIVAIATLGWTADRLGRRVFLMISGDVMGAGIAALAFAGGYAALLAALVVLYAAAGLYDVGINAAAVGLEKATGRRLMAVLHAGGMTLALVTREPPLVIAGFLVVGLALSAVVPIAFSAAGEGGGGYLGCHNFRLWRLLARARDRGRPGRGLGFADRAWDHSGVRVADLHPRAAPQKAP